MKPLLYLAMLAAFSASGQVLELPGTGGGITANATYVNAGANQTNNWIAYTNAVFAEDSGGLVIVGKGHYFHLVNFVPSGAIKNGVDQFMYPGVRIGLGATNVDPSYIYDDGSGAITCKIMGYGEFFYTNDSSGGILSLTTSGSKVGFEAYSTEAYDGLNMADGTTSAFEVQDGCQLVAYIKSHGVTEKYDFCYGPGAGTRIYMECPRVYAGGDLIETGDVDNPGDAIFKFGYVESGTNGATIAQVGGNVDLEVNYWFNRGLGGTASALIQNPGNGTNYGIIRNTTIVTTNSATVPLICRSIAGSASAHTGLWFKNCTFEWPAPIDPIRLTNRASALRLENCSFVKLSSSITNIARNEIISATERIELLGSFGTSLPKPFATNITIFSTRETVLDSRTTPVPSAGSATTNMFVTHIPAHQLTNTGSQIYVEINNRYGGAFAGANTNALLLGSSTLLNTGSQTSSNCAFRIVATITSVGPTSQSIWAALYWGGTGTPYAQTNFILRILETNGISTALRYNVHPTANDGCLTNENYVVKYIPPL